MTKTYKADINDFIEDSNNANRGTEEGQRLIRQSVHETGLHRGIVVDSKNRIPAGNKTFAAAKKAGITDVIVVETSGRTLVITKRTDFDLEDADPNSPARRAAYYDNATALIDIDFDPEILLADQMAGVDLDSIIPDEMLEELFSQIDSNGDEDLSQVRFKEYDESIESEVDFIKCPHCGEEFPK